MKNIELYLEMLKSGITELKNEKYQQEKEGIAKGLQDTLKALTEQLHIHGVVVRSEQLNNGAEFTYHEWIRYNFKEIDKNTYIQKGDHRQLVKYTERELRGKFARSKRVV